MSPRSVDATTTALLRYINGEIMAPGHPLAASDPLEPAGVDSMALLKVLLFIEREFGFWIPDEDLVPANVATISALAQYVADRGSAD
jgi:acyl carrier protein